MRATAKLNEMPFLHSFFLETRFVSSDATPPTLPNNADAFEVKKSALGKQKSLAELLLSSPMEEIYLKCSTAVSLSISASQRPSAPS